MDAPDIDRLKSECFLLQSIDSEHVLKPRSIYEWNNKIHLIFEYMDGESFDKVITKCHKKLKDKSKR